MLTLLLATQLALAAPQEDCTEPGGIRDFLDAAKAGEAAFGAMDLSGLQAARERGLSILPCLAEPVTTTDAAAFHRMMALEAFTAGDEDQVVREFHAARRLSPGYELPPSVAPEDHPLHDLYEQAVGVDEGGLEATIPPQGGFVNVDGVRGAPRPTGISVIVQVFEKDASLQRTLYLRPEDSLPNFGPLPIDEIRRKRRRVSFSVATGAGAAATGVLYGLAWQSNRAFWDTEDPVPDSRLPTQQARTNSLVWGSAAAGALTLGLGAATVITW